ncbi:MAG: DUF3592 domain-containing protein [Oscillatoriales cyanobacterium C42_A2020_001]|nr:DUF3592 domain-containing protein [Leptolyngbyaceae cyanobacterium C42_A2020_001]
MKPENIPGFLVFSCITLLLGTSGYQLLSNSFHTLRISLQSSERLPTEGQIHNFRVRAETDAVSGVAHYYCQFSYIYVVEGIQYYFTFWQGHFTSSDQAEAQAQAKYSANHKIQIFYNPKKPGEATLTSGFDEGNLATCLIMFLTGILFFFGSILAFRWVVAWFVLGEPPVSGCYDPDIFFQRKWVQVPCNTF